MAEWLSIEPSFIFCLLNIFYALYNRNVSVLSYVLTSYVLKKNGDREYTKHCTRSNGMAMAMAMAEASAKDGRPCRGKLKKRSNFRIQF